MKAALTIDDVVDVLGGALSNLRQHAEAFALDSDEKVRDFVRGEIDRILGNTKDSEETFVAEIGAIRQSIEAVRSVADAVATDCNLAVEAVTRDVGLQVKTSADQLRGDIATTIAETATLIADELAKRDADIATVKGITDAYRQAAETMITECNLAIDTIGKGIEPQVKAAVDQLQDAIKLAVSVHSDFVNSELTKRDADIAGLVERADTFVTSVDAIKPELIAQFDGLKGEVEARLVAEGETWLKRITDTVEDQTDQFRRDEEGRENRLLEMRLEITNALRSLDLLRTTITESCMQTIDRLEARAAGREESFADLQGEVALQLSRSEEAWAQIDSKLADTLTDIDAALVGFKSLAAVEIETRVNAEIDYRLMQIEERFTAAEAIRENKLADAIAALERNVDEVVAIKVRDVLDGDPERFRGDPGIPGPQGEPGQPGKDGVDGKDGAHGEPGADGQDGKDGQTGEKGERGMPGMDGRSIEFFGLWKTEHEYRAGDVVAEGGSTWIALRQTHDERPSKMIESGPRPWALMAQRGAKGERGVPGATGPAGRNAVPMIDLRLVGKNVVAVFEDGTMFEAEIGEDFIRAIREALKG